MYIGYHKNVGIHLRWTGILLLTMFYTVLQNLLLWALLLLPNVNEDTLLANMYYLLPVRPCLIVSQYRVKNHSIHLKCGTNIVWYTKLCRFSTHSIDESCIRQYESFRLHYSLWGILLKIFWFWLCFSKLNLLNFRRFWTFI